MRNLLAAEQRPRLLSVLEWLIITGLAIVPLLMSFPYRVNIFLSWEGAYRMSEGQLPYRDFGMPLGYMYWVIPSLFFKLFGAQMISLVKAQVLLNMISGLAFRSILISLRCSPGVRFLAVLLYVISFSFFNFWPWYNHTVIVYEMVGLAFLLRYCLPVKKRRTVHLILAGLFIFFSFFTKQDGGALAFLLALVLLTVHSAWHKQIMPVAVFVLSFLATGALMILPFTPYSFGYWFNHGQAPHTARLSVGDILNEFFISSQWIKFYLVLISLLLIARYRQLNWRGDYPTVLFALLTFGILAEAAILQVTSYTPPDNNIFYHSFAWAFILHLFMPYWNWRNTSWSFLLAGSMGLLLWWSGVFWKYLQRLLPSAPVASLSATGENVVNRHTYMIRPASREIPASQWGFSSLSSFKKIYMPQPTIAGIERLMKMDSLRNGNARVLNMTELTPLAKEFPFSLEKGEDVPLWYHLGVGMFNREAARYEQRIAAHHYQLVLFEYIPTLNNFYPFRVREALKQHYRIVDSFPAPRRGEETQGMIEVYLRP